MAEEETGFESAIKAGELPYYCALTTLPDNAPEEAGLLSEDEQLRGYFAKQENLFSGHTKPQEAGVQLALGATSPLIQSILKPLVARGDWEGLARKAVWIAAMAQTWGPPTDAVVDLGYDPAKAACASMQAIVLLAGYERVAKAMSDAVKPPIVMMSRGPWILVATEYSSEFLSATKSNRSLFEKYEWWDTNRFSAISRQPWLGSRNGQQFVRFVRAADEGGAPIRLINILRGIWNDALILFDDKLQVLPIKEIVETPPASADPPAVSQFTATGDQPATPALQYRIGMMVQYQDDEYYVVRASTPGWDGAQQLAIAKDPNGSRSKWIRVSTGEVQMIDADTDMEGIQRRMEQFATEIGEDIRPDELLSKPAPGLGIPEKFFEHQKIGAKFLWSKRRALLADVPGLGKAQPLDAKVLTPSGWVEMGDIQVGDAIVDPEGGEAIVTGVFPQGEKDIYRVFLADGTSTECCKEHLWLVHTKGDRARGTDRVLPLEAMMGDLWQDHNGVGQRNYFLPLTQPVQYAELQSPLQIDPYLLGVLIGDGNMSRPEGAAVKFTSVDDAIIKRVAAIVERDYGYCGLRLAPDGPASFRLSRPTGDQRVRGSNPLVNQIRHYGLAGKHSWDKFVPSDYMHASVEARMEVLRGLLDTDGDVSKEGGYAFFSSTSSELAENVENLVRSLGGFCTKATRQTHYTYKGEKKAGRVSYRLHIRMGECPFYLPRKIAIWKPSNLARAIDSIEYVGKKAAQCIRVSSKRHTYLTDDFIVTHNTAQCITAMESPIVVVSESNMKGGWLREINFWRPEFSVAIIEGESPDKITKEQREADVVICNYNILHAHVTWMIARGNKTLVADEAQNLKNLTYKHEAVSQDARGVIKKRWIPSASASAQARAFWLLSEGHPKNTRMYLLSGTPMMNQRSKELFPYLNLIDENRWGDYRAFCVRYCAGKQPNKRRGRQSKGPACDGRSRSDELFRVLKKYMLRREKDLLNLPELTRSTVHVGMDPDSARKYQEASQRFAMFLREKYGHLSPQEMEYKIEKALKAEILTQMQALKEIVAIGKVPAMLTVLQNFRESTDRPVVIMCFRETPAMMIKQGIEAINSQIRQDRNAGLSPESGGKEIRYAFLGWGQTNSKKTTKTVEAFQNGEIDVVVCNLMSAKGITLTRAQDMYFLERAWRPADLRQAEDRIHRIGQKNACSITYLDCPGTVDESLAKLLALKAAAIAAVIDGVDLDESEALACVLGDMLGANMDYSDRDSILGGVIGALTSGGLVRNGRPEFVFGGDADI